MIVTIGERIKQRRQELGLSADQVAEAIGKNRATIYRYESDEIEKFPIGILYPLAEVLRTTPQYLMGWEDYDAPLPANIMPMPEMRKIPLLGSIACGAPILAEEHIDGEVDIPTSVHADFALRCKGDSMINARIFDGDIVYVRQQDTVENGEIAAVLVDGTEATLKRVRLFEDHIILEPANPMYQPMAYWNEEMNNVRILGKAVAFTSFFA